MSPLRSWLAAILLCATASLSAQSPATPPPAPAKSDTILVKLPDASLDSVLELLERITGRTVLRPAALPQATCNLVMSQPVTKAEAVQAIETVLALNQIGIAPLGEKFLKVVALNQVKNESPTFIDGSSLDLPPSSKVASKLFQLEFLRAAEFAGQTQNILNPFVQGGVQVFEKGNALLITDTVSNLQRIENLLRIVDRPADLANLTPKFYPLQYTKASDLATRIQTLTQSQQLQAIVGTSVTFAADDRTNQLIVIADARQQPLIAELIAKLDIKGDSNTRTELIYLKNATAKDVATLLTTIISGQSTAAQKAGQSSARAGSVTQPQPANANAKPATTTASPDGGSASTEFSSLITVTADERTNAVVVNGTLDDIRLIKELVDKIDVVLPQVRIEVVVAEVTLNDDDATGISSLGLKVENNTLTGFTGSTPGLSAGGSGTDSFATIARPGNHNQLSGVIALSASRTKSNVSILANPTLVTTHNKEARLFVGESRPTFGQIQTVDNTTSTSSTSASALRSSISQTEAGIELTIKPLIGSDGTVQLEVDQKFNAFGADVNLGSDLKQPTVNKRETKSFLSVSDKEIVVLGGYQSNSTTKTRERFGPIPLIGDLLGKRSKGIIRTELMVFIRPHVIRGVANTTADTMEKLTEYPTLTIPQKTITPEKADEPATAKPADTKHGKR